MKTGLERLHALRANLNKQARAELTSAERHLRDAREALAALDEARTVGETSTAANQQTLEAARDVFVRAVNEAQREWVQRANVAQALGIEEKQTHRLVERRTTEMRKEAERREQRTSDDRAAHRRGRR